MRSLNAPSDRQPSSSPARLDLPRSSPRRALQRFVAAAAFALGALAGNAAAAGVSIAQSPLTVTNNVPSNLVLTPSVEWPTVLSMANIGSFDQTKTYYGYFDPNKCYQYQIAGASVPVFAGVNGGTKNYFAPVSTTSNRQCSGAWSGNYLNWSATQTIDVFRSTLTGGYRVVDTSTLTILEKARHTGQSGTGYLGISNSQATVAANTPFSYAYISTKLAGLGNRMYFVVSSSSTAKDKNGDKQSLQYLLDNPWQAKSKGVVEYDPSQKFYAGWVYSANIDVQVCASGLLESNCVQYGSNYKPEGLIQKYSKVFKYSVFGYLNISNTLQDGAALRAAQTYVGPDTYDPPSAAASNPHAEWDAATGVFVQNPDAAAATDTTAAYATDPAIANSGVINYLNKFGEMTNQDDKSYDPVSEMYYAAIRYLKNQGPVASYNNISTYGSGVSSYVATDGFPVIRTWDDPWKFSCQRSFILGIGDVNTWNDKNLPGNLNRTNEPAVPTEVSGDSTVNVVTATSKVAQLENITINGMTAGGGSFTGRDNSAYIAGLAYDSHTKDMRPDLSGSQTISTYWVDVMENQSLLSKSQNQYWLAAKYGGFTVPAGYDPYANTTALTDSWWWTSGQTLSSGDKRPDNFFTGGDAQTMKSSLEKAFSQIASESAGSAVSLSTNSTQMNSGTRVYQASYKAGAWSGSLKAYNVNPATQTISTLAWDAASLLPASTARSIYTLVGGTYVAFNAANVAGTAGWTSDLVNYIRGDQSKEVQNGGTYRNRTTALGDIVDSQPIYVGAPNPDLFSGASFTGASSFGTYASNQATRTPTIYVAANDGMLHGFSASTGVETFAYMPGAVLAAAQNPSILAQTSYGNSLNPHQDFNDGELTVADVYTGSPAQWRTVLVGTTGRGNVKAIYALDVTDPANVKFLWEKTAADSGAIGQIAGKPIIAQTGNGSWSVLLGNGYNSTSGKAFLLQIALASGTISTHATDSTTDNGLATPLVWIANPANGISTTAYAGDLNGNVWSFDLSSSSSSGSKVFTATDSSSTPQPITAPMFAAKDPSTSDVWLFFGTGKYLDTLDSADKTIQTWYALDVTKAGGTAISKTDLIQRSITSEVAASPGNPSVTPPVPPTLATRTISTGASNDMNGHLGWYLDLIPPTNVPEGERMIVANQIYQNLLVATTLIPDMTDVCAPTGRGWVMAVDPFTGTNPKNVFFDLNGDAQFNGSDEVGGTAAAGIGLSSLTGSATFAGQTLLANQNGAIFSDLVNPQGANQGRVSWRELVNN